MSSDYKHIAGEAVAEIEACQDKEALNALRVKYLGRKGVVQDWMAKIPTLPPGERREFGASVNAQKITIAEALSEERGGSRSIVWFFHGVLFGYHAPRQKAAFRQAPSCDAGHNGDLRHF